MKALGFILGMALFFGTMLFAILLFAQVLHWVVAGFPWYISSFLGGAMVGALVAVVFTGVNFADKKGWLG